MLASERIAIARWGNALGYQAFLCVRSRLMHQETKFPDCDKNLLNSLVLWASGRYHGDLSKVSDEELKKMISLQFGYAADEIDPHRVIVTTPEALVPGTNYELAGNGYRIGKYLGSRMSPAHPGAICGCNGKQVLFSFEKGDRGPVIFETGLVAV